MVISPVFPPRFYFINLPLFLVRIKDTRHTSIFPHCFLALPRDEMIEEQGFLRWPGFNPRKLPTSVQVMPLAILGLVVTQFCDSYKESNILVSVRPDVCDPTCFSLVLPFFKPLGHSLTHLLFIHRLSKYVPSTPPCPYGVTF